MKKNLKNIGNVFLIAALIPLAPFVIPFCYLYRTGSKMRRIGYSPLAALGIITLVFLSALGLIFFSISLILTNYAVTLLSSYVLAVVVVIFVRKWLPLKKHYSGSRKTKISYKFVGTLVQTIAVAAGVLLLINNRLFTIKEIYLSIILLYGLFVNSYRIIYFDKLFKEQTSVSVVDLLGSRKDIILYVRSFTLDNNYFAGIKLKNQDNEFGYIFETKLSAYLRDPVMYLTFQKFFKFRIEQDLGFFLH